MNIKRFTLIALIALGFAANAQLPADFLPAGFAPGEERVTYEFSTTDLEKAPGLSTPPPFASLRTMAEWEEIDALTITWTAFPAIQRRIIQYAQTECKVYVVCSDSNVVKNDLIANNIPQTSNIKYIQAGFNSIWCRDYAANPVYVNDVDSLIYVDWVYNRPSRQRDDTLARRIASYAGIKLWETRTEPNRIIGTGGNWMSDGFGTGFASKLTTEENPNKTEAEIDTIFKDFMGTKRYIKMEMLPYDGIHHIDMHMKLLDEQTLLVGEYPAGVSDGPQIEANIQFVLNNYNSVFGTPYKLVRMPQTADAQGDFPDQGGAYYTYTNAVFVNKTLLVPIYNQAEDDSALNIYRKNLPGYNVVGIPCTDIIQQSGAIHCITHSIGVRDPLLISHQPLEDTYDFTNPYPVTARIQHKSGIQSAQLYWTTDTTQGFQVVPMTFTDPQNNLFTGNIPPQQPQTKIYYYVQGQAVSGKQQVRPITAPTGFWQFKILGNVNVNELAVEALQPYPNPASAITCIPVLAKGAMDMKVYVTDITGKVVENLFSGKVTEGKRNFFINAANYAAGSYLVVVESSQGKSTKKLMVK